MSNSIQNGGELTHYGVLGMKWGVRRFQNKVGIKGIRSTQKDPEWVLRVKDRGINPNANRRMKKLNEKMRRQTTSSRGLDNEKKQNEYSLSNMTVKKKLNKNAKDNSVKKMSDQELRQRINRIQMEKQYAQLTKKEKSAGEKFVKEVMTNAAKQTATNYVSKYMTKAVDELIKRTSKNH